MSSLSVAGVDPAFVAVATALYGDSVDPRELWDICKSMPDSSAVGTQGGRRKRAALAGGLIFGTVAEGHATAQAAGKAFPSAARSLSPLTSRIPRPRLPETHGKAGLALQATNMAIGVTAARELLPKRRGKAVPVGKAAPRHMRPQALVSSGARLRRAQRASEASVSKGLRAAMRMTEHLASAEHRSFVQGIRTDAMKQQFAGRKGRVVPAHAAKPAGGGRHSSAGRSGGAPTLAAGSAAAGGAAGAASARRKPPVAKSIDLTFTGTISKVDPDKRQVFGWASLSQVDGKPVVDLQGDYVDITEIEKSAYSYVLNSRKGGDMHRRIEKFDAGPLHTADLIESIVFTPEKLEKMGLAPDALPLGWWVGYHVNDDEQWADVKAGKRLGFSIHGTGVRKAIA